MDNKLILSIPVYTLNTNHVFLPLHRPQAIHMLLAECCRMDFKQEDKKNYFLIPEEFWGETRDVDSCRTRISHIRV